MDDHKFTFNSGHARLLICAALLSTLAGCVGYVQEPRPARVYVAPAVVAEDDFIYYPNYEVYYSNSRRQYYYMDGRSWVWRPAPPRVSVNVLFASPSVRMDFHDSPAMHHNTIVHEYPRNWSPGPGNGRGPDRGRPDNRRDDGRDDRGGNNRH
jgi:hypothetical protein